MYLKNIFLYFKYLEKGCMYFKNIFLYFKYLKKICIDKKIIAGIVDAHNGTIVRTWDNIQYAKIPAVIGNDKTGASFVEIDVEMINSTNCRHRNVEKRVEVRWPLL